MAETLTLEPTPAEAAEMQVQMAHYLTEIKRLNTEMAADQPLLDTLTVETRMLASETRIILNDIWATIARIETL